jgi:Ni,Fe-hydrogenase III large subunit
MTTTVTVNGVNYNISNDKVQHIVALLEAYKSTQTNSHQQVKEVLTSNPNVDGRSLING